MTDKQTLLGGVTEYFSLRNSSASYVALSGGRPNSFPGDETSPTAAPGKQESPDRKRLHPTTKAKTGAKKPKKNQDGVHVETVTSRESDKTQVENSVNMTQDEDHLPQR